jgi:hypothetical protein
MIRPLVIALCSTLLLAACGADGEPVQPSLNAGVNVSGSGVSVNGGIGLSKGPFGLTLGF